MPLIDCQGMFPLDLEHAIGKAALIQFGEAIRRRFCRLRQWIFVAFTPCLTVDCAMFVSRASLFGQDVQGGASRRQKWTVVMLAVP